MVHIVQKKKNDRSGLTKDAIRTYRKEQRIVQGKESVSRELDTSM